MTWVKICGMTNLEDALLAVEAGADAVGFVFYEKSPRCVTVETVREICEKLPASVEKIGVFVDAGVDPGGTLLKAGLTGMQCYFSMEGFAGHRSSTNAISTDILPRNARFMVAFPVNMFSDPVKQVADMVEGLAKSRSQMPAGFSLPEGIYDTFVLDSGSVRTPGGTGKVFDWESAEPLSESFRKNGVKLAVAGGLTPENVRNAIQILKPWGVDVVSGVEASPGKKDPEKVRAFVRAVRETDRRVG